MFKTLPERTMRPVDWEQLHFFDPGEKWGQPDGMDWALLQALEQLRRECGHKVVIHCGKEPRSRGWHPTGRAVDLHIEGLDLLSQWLAASRYPAFTGLGVYTWWHRPGLHLDTRPKAHQGPIARWGSTGPGLYVPLDGDFIRIALNVG